MMLIRLCRDRYIANGRRSWQTLETVIQTSIVVPVLLSLTVESNGEFESLADWQRVTVQKEREFVAETVARVRHVGGLQVAEITPRVQRVSDVHRFVEIEVDHADCALDAEREGILDEYVL